MSISAVSRTVRAAAAALLISAPAFGQFEGSVRMRAVTYGDADSTVVSSTVHFKGKLLAAVIDTSMRSGQEGKFIIRGDKNVMWIVVDREKKYMEIPLNGGDRPPDTVGRAKPKKTYTLARTGKTRTILQYACEEWTADEGDGNTAAIWATPALGDVYEGVVKWFDEMSMESATDRMRWERELASLKYFPLLVVRSEDGQVTEMEQVTAVAKEAVSATTFDAPAGYEKQVIDLNFEKMFEQMMKDMEKEGAEDTSEEGESEDDGGK